ncbi:MAG: DAK2 domain-containing protein, partial [Rhodoferax sp.]|nr:DAK2 domain-containing protein [Actinomycetota bacterium]
MLDHLDARAGRRWAVAALGRLSDQRADIDRSNVYPVADGDTGTNLLLTLEAGAAAVEGLVAEDLAEVATVFAHATLLGARGSSGVILAQIVRGWAEVLTEQAGDRTRPAVGAEVVAAALRRGAEGAFAAVGRPVEGTMLTVARAAADGAVGTTLSEVVTAAAAAGRAALARTPDQLEVLAAAGAVDAGGSGLVVLLDVLAEVVTGTRSVRRRPRPGRRPSTAASAASATPAVRRTSAASADHAGGPGRGAYEVMYLLDATAEAVAGLRSRLDVLGDSLVVVGGDGLWNVHVHTDHVAATIQAGIDVGRPHQLAVTRFADGEPGSGVPGSPPVVLLATASGPGLAAVLSEGGARLVGRLRRPVT